MRSNQQENRMGQTEGSSMKILGLILRNMYLKVSFLKHAVQCCVINPPNIHYCDVNTLFILLFQTSSKIFRSFRFPKEREIIKTAWHSQAVIQINDLWIVPCTRYVDGGQMVESSLLSNLPKLFYCKNLQTICFYLFWIFLASTECRGADNLETLTIRISWKRDKM